MYLTWSFVAVEVPLHELSKAGFIFNLGLDPNKMDSVLPKWRENAINQLVTHNLKFSLKCYFNIENIPKRHQNGRIIRI